MAPKLWSAYTARPANIQHEVWKRTTTGSGVPLANHQVDLDPDSIDLAAIRSLYVGAHVIPLCEGLPLRYFPTPLT